MPPLIGPVGHLQIEMERPIDTSTYLYVKFALEHFRKQGCKSVILELNTPGGEVFAAQKIAHILKESDQKYGMPVVAYLNNWAISAGAMLAYSCRTIAISPSASMGAAEPVMMSGGSMESASEKINSALRSEFANLASLYGRNPWIAEAMVDKDLILVKRGGEIVKIDAESEIRIGEDEVLAAKGKLLTLNAKQLMDLGVADWQGDLIQAFPEAKLVGYSNWKVDFFSFLSHPLVASLLMMGLMLGFYMEIQMGGFGWPACLGLSCLGLILLSQFALSAAMWLEVIIMAIGAALILLELFVLPTFGALGIAGILLFLGALFALGQPDFSHVEFSFDIAEWNLAAYSLYSGLGWFCGSLLVALLSMVFFSRVIFPRSSLFKKLIPPERIDTAPLDRWPPVGSHGIAFSTCRPAGQVEVEGEVYEATSEGGFIDKGEKVTIVRIETNRIIVR
jgi:membrane-bound ClpP family serine protease